MGLKLTHKGVCRYFSVCPRVSRVANRADSLGLYKRGSHCRGQRLQLGRDFALKSTTLQSHSGAVLKIRHDCVEVARNHNQKKMLLHLPRWWWLSGSRCHKKKAVGWKKKDVVPACLTGGLFFCSSWFQLKSMWAFSASLHRRKVKNNPEKSLIFVTLAEFKWKAGAEEVLFTSIHFHLSCLVESPGPQGVCPRAWHTSSVQGSAVPAGCRAEFRSISVCCGAFFWGGVAPPRQDVSRSYKGAQRCVRSCHATTRKSPSCFNEPGP